MPTNRKRIARGRAVYELKLEHLTIMEQIALMSGWHPRSSTATRWKNWPAFFRDSDAVRDELLADEIIRQVFGADAEPFADRVRRMEAGQVYDAHDHLGLRHPHAYVRGDAHVHDDIAPRGAPAVEWT